MNYKAAFAIGAFYLFYFALVGVYIIFLPKSLYSSGYSATEVGIIFASAPLMRFLLPFIFRRYGGLNHKTYHLSLLLTTVATLLFFISVDNFYMFFLVNLLYGASMGIILPFIDTIALKVITKEHYGKVRLWGSIGFMGIALWLGSMIQSSSQTLLYIFILATLTSVFGYIAGEYDNNSIIDSSTTDNKSLSLSKYWAFWLSALLMQVSFGGFYNFFTIYETAHGISLQMTTWLWSFGVLCEIAMLYFQSPLLKGNLLRLIEIATFAAVIRWLILWLYPDSLTMAFVAQSLHALNFALYYIASIAYVYELYTQKKLAQQFFLGISFGLGGSIGAIIAGEIYEYAPDKLFLSQAFIAFVAWIMIRVHIKRREGYESR